MQFSGTFLLVQWLFRSTLFYFFLLRVVPTHYIGFQNHSRFEKYCPRPVLLKCSRAQESYGELVKMQFLIQRVWGDAAFLKSSRWVLPLPVHKPILREVWIQNSTGSLRMGKMFTAVLFIRAHDLQ